MVTAKSYAWFQSQLPELKFNKNWQWNSIMSRPGYQICIKNWPFRSCVPANLYNRCHISKKITFPLKPFLLRFLYHFSCFDSCFSCFFLFFHFTVLKTHKFSTLPTHIHQIQMRKTFFQHHWNWWWKMVERSRRNFRLRRATVLDQILQREEVQK